MVCWVAFWWWQWGCRSLGCMARWGSPLRVSDEGHGAQLPTVVSLPAVHGGFQLGSVLLLRLENSGEGSEEEEEEDRVSAAPLEPGEAGGSLGPWRAGRSLVLDRAWWALVEQSCGARAVAELQRLREASEATLGRLEALEADVRFLCTELGAEKLLWSSRFLELLREQQGLRQRLQERPLQWDGGDSPEVTGDVKEPNASGSEGEGPAVSRNKETNLQKPPPAPFTS
ncbi:uncharacterized protein LOC118177665 isoform X2 [Oxyura jamaicensis]|uniref:uncharacterized protein LOC118177665 isoform X2 n=1 Tax=Oxyura jamaicensis TaxID=8884 RepID=UPI0015A6A14E|nr:uncharacterized protein LOC118177665 isoform X2 [Oxyura jamaicensis]